MPTVFAPQDCYQDEMKTMHVNVLLLKESYSDEGWVFPGLLEPVGLQSPESLVMVPLYDPIKA